VLRGIAVAGVARGLSASRSEFPDESRQRMRLHSQRETQIFRDLLRYDVQQLFAEFVPQLRERELPHVFLFEAQFEKITDK
jgi:hypothetical protein